MTAAEWIKWAGQTAYDSSWSGWKGAPRGMNWEVAAKMLAEKCAELQQEAATANARLDKLIGTNTQPDEFAKRHGLY